MPDKHINQHHSDKHHTPNNDLENEPIQEEEEQNQTPASHGMSKEEKKFWGTIVILALITFVIMAAGWYNNKDILMQDGNRTSIIAMKTLKENLDKKKGEISASLKEKQQAMEQEIQQKVDTLFAPVYGNIDTFLDFHYSIMGEYTELTAAATNNFTKLIEERLFGTDFQANHQQMLDILGEKLYALEKEHGKEVAQLATEDIDKEINQGLMERLTKDSLYRVGATLATVSGIKMASKALIGKLSLKLAGKLTSKFGTKLLVKTGVKTGGKMAAAGTAGAAGLACGPFAVICTPALAVGAWFAADAIVTSIDEVLTRDDFKKELKGKIDDMKREMMLKLQKPFVDELADFSQTIVEDFGKIEVKETIKEMMEVK